MTSEDVRVFHLDGGGTIRTGSGGQGDSLVDRLRKRLPPPRPRPEPVYRILPVPPVI